MIEVFKGGSRSPNVHNWYWRLKAGNGLITGSSEGYKKLASAINSIESILHDLGATKKEAVVRVIWPEGTEDFLYTDKKHTGRSFAFHGRRLPWRLVSLGFNPTKAAKA